MPLLNCVLFTLCLVYKLQKGYIEQDKQVSVLSYPTYPELFSQLQAIYLQAIYLQSLYQLTVIPGTSQGTACVPTSVFGPEELSLHI